MQIPEIPLNPNGKVDRKKLPAPSFQKEGSAALKRDLNDLEFELVKITSVILGHEDFDLSTNLLRAGLTSLSCIKLSAKIDEVLNVNVPVRDIMKNPTLLDIENAMIKLLLNKERLFTLPEIKEIEIEYPLSNCQLGIYLDCMKSPNSNKYNIPFQIVLSKDVDISKLHEAISRVIDSHPAIKVSISQGKDSPIQVLDDTPVIVKQAKITEEELEITRKRYATPFNIEKEKLYRIGIYETPLRVVLLACFHHIVFDGASLDLFIIEIGNVYNGDHPLQEKISVFEALTKEIEREGSDDWLEDKAYFDNALIDFDGVSEITPDMDNPLSTGELKEVTRKVNRLQVEKFCSDNAITPAALFLAASAYTIGRHTGKDDVYISGVSSGRSDTKLLNTMGMFVKTLPLILKKQAEQTSIEYIQSVQNNLTSSINHEGYPFIHIATDYNYIPSINYACELGLINEYMIGNENVVVESFTTIKPKFKTSIHIEEKAGDWYITIQYNNALYSASLMERFVETLYIALDNLMNNISHPVSKVSLVSEKQYNLIKGFNDTSDDSSETTLHTLFEVAVERNPGHTALIADEGSYTYAELNAESNKLAHALIKLGIKQEDRVAILLNRTGKVMIAMLGILKAGATYIPLDIEYPSERIAQVLDDSNAKLILCTHKVEPAAIPCHDIDELRVDQSTSNPNLNISPSNIAYIIYTSGSTGKPKGVMIPHRGIANYVNPHPHNVHVNALVNSAATMLSITTIAFDMFLKESMTCLCNGLTLVLANEEAVHDPIALAKLFNETKANAFNTTPSVMLEYTEHPALLAAIRNCKIIMCGAEKYPEALLKRLQSGTARLLNTYGPTEISVSCNGKELTGVSRVTVGKPLLNVHEYVVDTDDNILPIGMVGELLIGGRGVATGYVNLPGLTADKFISYYGNRMYRSGDYARWTQDGEIEILGRKDNQVKLRGLRIELGEIENVIHQIDGIRSCIVVIKKIINADHLCAYYVADREISPEEIKTYARQTLAGYMIPTALTQLDSMPKTPNGKTDIRALPMPAPIGQSEYVSPIGETEEKLCEIFAQILGIDRVGATDNFFDLGGTSLAVTRIIIAIDTENIIKTDGSKISYSDVFAHPTPRDLIKAISQNRHAISPNQTCGDTGHSSYDYTQIDALLAENSIESFRLGTSSTIGNVLLTGSTGFLGIHVLYHLLTNTESDIVCLVRPGKYSDVTKRLQNLLFYYFEDITDYTDRLTVINGDMTDSDCLKQIATFTLSKGDNLEANKIHTVINCAANVTHFSRDSSTFDVNTSGVHNLIDFCKIHNSRLIHISTASVAGISVDGYPTRDTQMDETMLYFGQNLENQYISSKFTAEKIILEANLTGLDAKIMRVGNLMARKKDSEFQINAQANSFIGRLRAYHAIGCFPYSSYHVKSELSPIDETTAAILKLAETPKNCRVYHPINNHHFFMGDIILTMNEIGLNIELVEDDIFQSAMALAMKDSKRAEKLTSLIAYQNIAKGRPAFPVAVKNDFTTGVLLRLGYRWQVTDTDYIRKFLIGLMGLGLFDS
jgi:amino acid adenylation domain-containing protein